MQSDRQKWNEKYRNKAFSSDPTPIVKKYAALAPEGRALDIATQREPRVQGVLSTKGVL